MPKRPTVWHYNEMGVFFYSRGADDLAISEFKHALKTSLFPVPQVHMNLGAAYPGKKLNTEAEAALRESVRLDPKSQMARMLLARTLLARGRPCAGTPGIRACARRRSGHGARTGRRRRDPSLARIRAHGAIGQGVEARRWLTS
jgi:Tfp pilus assembly protein PilF